MICGGAIATLTTDHALSSYGIPIMLLDGEVLAPTTMICSGPIQCPVQIEARRMEMMPIEHEWLTIGHPLDLESRPNPRYADSLALLRAWQGAE